MQFLVFLGDNIIYFMFGLLAFSLLFRYLAYRSCKYDYMYYNTFIKEVEKTLISFEKEFELKKNKSEFITMLLDKVSMALPHRSLRFSRGNKKLDWRMGKDKKESEVSNSPKKMSLTEYDSNHSLISNILNERSALESNFPPNCYDLTTRILERDRNWVKLFGVVPIEGLSRFIDILPGIFVILGILGTFIGISLALPEIANINFENLNSSSGVLGQFVDKVTLSMSTSIIGIICSLSMTLLNTLFPIKGVRNLIHKNVVNCLENLWYSIHGGETMEVILGKVLPEIRDLIKDMTLGSKSNRPKVAS